MSFRLAITDPLAWVGLAGYLMCLAAIGYALFSRRPPEPFVRPSFVPMLLLGGLVFLALWLWLNPVAQLLGWALLYGDGPGPIRHYWPHLTALGGLVYGAFVALRGWSGRSGRRFLQVHFVAAILLLLLFGAFAIFDSGGEIYGKLFAITPRAAAERALRERYPDFGARGVLTTRGQYGEYSGAFSMPDSLSYIVLEVEKRKPIARISVAQTEYFLWTVTDYEWFPLPKEEELALAKSWVERDYKYIVPIILRDIIQQHPDTDAAKEARRLLKQYEEPWPTEELDKAVK